MMEMFGKMSMGTIQENPSVGSTLKKAEHSKSLQS